MGLGLGLFLEVAGRVVSPKFARKINMWGHYLNLRNMFLSLRFAPFYCGTNGRLIFLRQYMFVMNLMKRKLFYLLKYDTFRTQLFGIDLSRLMGPDGIRGLPRVIVDAISYLRLDGSSSLNDLIN